MKLLANLRRILTLPCEEAAELVSASLDRRLTRTERWALTGHLMVCQLCRHFRRQILSLRHIVRRHATEELPNAPALSSEARARITEALHRTKGNNP